MSPDLDKALCEKYPLIFADRLGDPGQTLMCWGISCGDGWYDLLDTLCSNIQGHINSAMDSHRWTLEHNRRIDEDPAYVGSNGDPYHKRAVPCPVEQALAVQVKEKFGTLRFYCDGGDDAIQGMISLAESMSARLCEECGNRAQTRGGSWIRTLCEQHHVKLGLGASDEFLP